MESKDLQFAKREARLKTVENVGKLRRKYHVQCPEEVLLRDRIRLLSKCENNCELLLKYDSSSSEYYRANIAEFARLSMCYGYLLRSAVTVPLGVRDFGGIIRYGLITLVDLQEGDFIGEYTGIIQVSDGGLLREDHRGYSSDYAWDYPDFPVDWPDLEISSENAGNALRYVNHSFEPNCRVEHTLLDGFWQLFFLADQDIPAGTQLLVNYGEEYWANDMREMVYI